MSLFVSVIVITKNNAKTIERCITHLLNQDYPREKYEIVFVDGHSTDGTDKLIKEYAKTRSFIRLYYENYGTMGYARNLGINKSKGDIIVFTDGDAYPPRNWVKRIVDAFNNDNKLAVVGGLDILISDNKICGYSVMDSWRRLNKTVGAKAIACIKTVNFAIRRDVVLAYDGFDANLSHHDETELMARVYSNAKINILYDPQIYVYHENVTSSSIRIRIKKIFKKSAASVPILLRKHMIRVALASPICPIATSFYMVLTCVFGIPLLIILSAIGLLVHFLITLSLLYLILIGVYTFFASLRTKKFALATPLALTLDCAIRLAGTFFGLVKWLWNRWVAKRQ